MFIAEHLTQLRELEEVQQGWVGSNPFKWASFIFDERTINNQELSTKFNRKTLLSYCSNQNTSNESAVISVLAWGGMRRDHGRRLFMQKDDWLDTIDDLRKRKFKSRKLAFERFYELRKSNKTPGLGIAYYTKLICFLAPDLQGYIMDQWTGKSINLLTGRRIVNVSRDGWVNDSNNGLVYDEYCCYIEELAMELNCSPLTAEEKIFSVGRGKGQWRNYLIKALQ